jgi:hypothetical protein
MQTEGGSGAVRRDLEQRALPDDRVDDVPQVNTPSSSTLAGIPRFSRTSPFDSRPTLSHTMCFDGSVKTEPRQKTRDILSLQFSSDFSTSQRFIVTQCQHGVILSKAWLTAYNPRINWRTNTLSLYKMTADDLDSP